MRSISYRPRAALDLDGITVYLAIEQENPAAAEQVTQTIFDAIERAADLPTIGRAFQDDDLQRTYHRVRAGSYWVYYTYDDNTLTVWRIFHTSRDTDMFGFHTLGHE